MQVPFYPQRLTTWWEEAGFDAREDAAAWEPACCGAVSLTMAVHALGEERPTVRSVIQRLVDGGWYVEPDGWVHEGLRRVAESYGVRARTAMLRTPRALAQALVDGGLCIASVAPGFRGLRRSGHLVLVSGAVTRDGRVRQFLVHDPAGDAPRPVSAWRFFLHSSGRAILLVRPQV